MVDLPERVVAAAAMQIETTDSAAEYSDAIRPMRTVRPKAQWVRTYPKSGEVSIWESGRVLIY